MEEEGSRSLACSICGKTFKTKSHLVRHLQIHKPSSCVCNICDKVLASKKSLNIHWEKHKQDLIKDKSNMCSICKNIFTSEDSLNNHMKIHSPQENFALITESYENDHQADQNAPLSKDLSSNSSFHGIKCVNPRNDCYVNSTVNAIFSSNYIRDDIMTAEVSNENVTMLKSLLDADGPHDIRSLKSIKDKFDNNKFENDNQQDSQEFLQSLLEDLAQHIHTLRFKYKFDIDKTKECLSDICKIKQELSTAKEESCVFLPMFRNSTVQLLINDYCKPEYVEGEFCTWKK